MCTYVITYTHLCRLSYRWVLWLWNAPFLHYLRHAPSSTRGRSDHTARDIYRLIGLAGSKWKGVLPLMSVGLDHNAWRMMARTQSISSPRNRIWSCARRKELNNNVEGYLWVLNVPLPPSITLFTQPWSRQELEIITCTVKKGFLIWSGLVQSTSLVLLTWTI